MITADSSVVVAGLTRSHEGHAAAREALRNVATVPGHVLLETYSVLTRLPPPHRLPPRAVHDLLESHFPESPLTLEAGRLGQLLAVVGSAGLRGGAIFDAFISATALEAGATLRTGDVRAIGTYEVVGVDFELIA